MNKEHFNIEAAKAGLPLPDLLRKLGFEPPGAGFGNMASPFTTTRRQKTESFSIFQKGNAWGWKDRSGGGEVGGDEITFLEKFEGISKGDAITRFCALAGVGKSHDGLPERKAGHVSSKRKKKAPPSRVTASPAGPAGASIDWPGAVAKLTDDHLSKLAEWRGISVGFFQWLRKEGFIGLCKESVAFPVHDDTGGVIAAHIRPKTGRWFFAPRGQGLRPLVFGDPRTASKTMVFESQWDAFAIMAAVRWHEATPDGWAVLITRGASNGRLAARVGGAVYAWPQNDEEKDGKQAGEEWLREVAANVAGEMFRVATPPEHEDANEWTRAGSVDVWAAIEAAFPMEKPLTKFEKATGGRIAEESKTAHGNAPPPFDPVPVIEDLGLYWLQGSPSYFLRREDAGRARFLEMGAAEVKRKLRVRGYRARPNHEAGEIVSQVDRVLDAVTETHSVDYAASIGGTTAGVYDLPAGRVLVRESPYLISPAGDDCGTIEAFLTALLGGDGAALLCCWLKVAYEALRAGERRPGQALIIVGPPDCGKSRIQHQIITPILAGRSADPKSFFFGRTDFNAEMIGSEHLLIEEVPSSSRHEERVSFGERIKEVVANDTARLHKKNRDAMTVSPFWRLSITINDNPEKLRCLPPLTDDLVEKIIMLPARRVPEFWEQFSHAPDPRKAFRDAIANELPAFVQWLTVMPIPEKLQDRRYGVKSFISEDVGHLIFEGEPEYNLLLLIDKGLFPEDGEAGPWQGDAEDIKLALCAEGLAGRGHAIKLLGSIQLSTLGIWLGRLAEKFPERFSQHRTAAKRVWTIKPLAT